MKMGGSFGYEVFSLSQDFKSEVIQLQRKVLNQFGVKDNAPEQLLDIYARDKSQWIVNYDIVRYFPDVFQLSFHDEVLRCVKSSRLKKPVFSASKIPLRCDMPFDAPHDFPWHQDYPYNLGSENSVTVWIPLQDTTIEMGALEVLDGPYLNGPIQKKLFPFEPSGILTKSAVEDLICDERNSLKIVEIKAGMILVFSQFLCHRSGKNISNQPRMSLQVRFSDLEDPFFNKVNFNFSKENNIFSYSEALEYISGHRGK